MRVPCIRMLYVALPCQSARPGGYHPPLTRSPLFQGKRAFLRCTALPINCALRCIVVPISRTRRLSPIAGAVPPLSEKEGFLVHHPLPSFMSNSLRGCTFPSLLPCGRRGTACGGGWRTRWLMRVPCIRMLYVALSCQLAGPAGYHPPLARYPLFQRKRAFWCITHCLLS